MIEIRNVDFYYGDFHALKNVNMTIPKSEITAFIGPFRMREEHVAQVSEQNERSYRRRKTNRHDNYRR